MSWQDLGDLSDMSMLELFRVETENQTGILIGGLLELERDPTAASQLETLMRAAHSLKGAARIIDLPAAAKVAHAMEDCFVAAQHGKIRLGKNEIDTLLRGVDLLSQLAKGAAADLQSWGDVHAQDIEAFLADISSLMGQGQETESSRKPAAQPSPPPSPAGEGADKLPQPGGTPSPISAPTSFETTVIEITPAKNKAQPEALQKHEAPDAVVRLTAENLNRLLGLAGESLVESRWLHPFTQSMFRLKQMQSEVTQMLDALRHSLRGQDLPERSQAQLHEVFDRLDHCRDFLVQRLEEMDLYDRRSARLSHRLYQQVLQTRMRPFGDGMRRFPRMVRDLAHALGKEVRLEIIGEKTQVDRDILEKLETPLAHLVRNALDHGCQKPEERRRAGKGSENVVRIEARHSAGMLLVTVADDGTGIDPQNLREKIVQRKLSAPAVVERMSQAELLEFLFLPGFTMKDAVTEISGRGVGLDVVQSMVKSVRGTIRVSTKPGKGTRFQLQLPLTLSVLRTLLVGIGGEPYAIPLGQIERTVRLTREKIETLEGRQHFNLEGEHVGLVAAHQVLDCSGPQTQDDLLSLVVLSERSARYGLVVDRFLGERELVVQPLDPRLGKVQDISAAALMEDGSPVLIVDVADILRSIEKLLARGQLAGVQPAALEAHPKHRRRVLAVDDSLTVRELERKLLASRGYLADVAVDGMDGWNAVRTGNYDLVITDVDMPRMDGIELATLIKNDPQLKSLPVMIVSYKDREEDRIRGLNAGADYYLTKGSFHDETLLQAVADLIGEPES